MWNFFCQRCSFFFVLLDVKRHLKLWRGIPPREEKGGSIPRPSVFELTSPKDWPLKQSELKSNKSCQHSMTYNRLDGEGNVGHCRSMTGWHRERRKSQMIGWDFSTKKKSTFSSEEIWKRIFISRQTLARDGRQVSQAPRVEQDLWTEDSRKGLQPDSREMPLARKRKEPEK